MKYQVQIWNGFALGQLTPVGPADTELSSIEADDFEDAMKSAIRQTDLKRVAYVSVKFATPDSKGFQAFLDIQVWPDGTITHSETKESTPHLRVPRIFSSDTLN